MVEKKPETVDFTDVDFSDPLVLKTSPFRLRKTPVIVTLADSQITEVDIQKMLEAGMNVAKFKLSTSGRGDKLRILGKIEKAVAACCIKYSVPNWPIATCIELKTCIIKSGLLENEKEYVPIEKNSEVILTYNIAYFNKCNSERIFIDNQFLVIDVKAETEISIAADEIILKCKGKLDEKSVRCLVTKGGMLTNLCNVCIRHVKHSRPLLTKKDLELVKFALEYKLDSIIINYVRHPETLIKIKKFIKLQNVKRPFLIGGICTEEGLDNIDEIIKETDGLILSREYLTYEIHTSRQSRMPQIQKWLAGKCLQAGKPFYISGGIFEKALKNGNFVNSEISDVTNAILDNVAGFILKDCYNTDILIEVLRGMNELCYTVEPLAISKTSFRNIVDEMKIPVNAAKVAAISCATIANQTNARVIIIPTVSGKTIKYLQCMRPSCIVMTVSTDIRAMCLLRIYRSIMPIMYSGVQHNKWKKNISARISFAVQYAVQRSWLIYGDTYITLQRGTESSSFCDTVRIWKVSISKKHLVECPDEDTTTSKSLMF